MKRMDPSFSEKSLGFRSFSDFLRARSDVVDLDESSTTRMVRLHRRANWQSKSHPTPRGEGCSLRTMSSKMTQRKRSLGRSCQLPIGQGLAGVATHTPRLRP